MFGGTRVTGIIIDLTYRESHRIIWGSIAIKKILADSNGPRSAKISDHGSSAIHGWDCLREMMH